MTAVRPSEADAQAEFVLVPVPRNRILDVYALLGGASRPGGASDSAGEWTSQALERALKESPESLVKAFRYLAQRPGQPVTSRDLADGIRVEQRQLGGVLGAFARRSRHRYQMQTMPFEVSRSHEVGMRVYEMPAGIATLVNQWSETEKQGQI